MNELNIYKQTAKMVAFTVLAIALCRFTQSYFAPLFVVMGFWCAFSGKLGWSLVFYILMPFFVILNPGVLPKTSPIMAYSMRFGPLAIGLVLAFMANGRRGRHRLPLFGLVPFLGVACVSSVSGWAPSVSYMKLINFLVFLFGLWFGTQNLQDRPKDVFILRSFFLAMAIVIIFGSLLTIAVPSIGYRTTINYALKQGGEALAEEVLRSRMADSQLTLFCGLTNHSQALAPAACCFLGWVVCDMLFIERKFDKLHLALVLGCLPLLYMTRSRVALLASTFTLAAIYLYAVPKIRLPVVVKQHLAKGMTAFFVFVVLLAVAAELKSGAMSGWVRKYQNKGGGKSSLTESVVSSRMGLIEQSIDEFKRNPMFGSGFQVAWYTREMMKFKKGLVISASVEKGVLPVMVLGETGIVGEFFFLAFVCSFFMICSRRGYYVTNTMFATFLMTNMAEATFFSPGGIGGIMWMICLVGGFTLDTTIIFRKNLQQQWGQMAAMEQARQMQEAERRRRLGLD